VKRLWNKVMGEGREKGDRCARFSRRLHGILTTSRVREKKESRIALSQYGFH
jgi:hypothetical protein